MDDTQRRLWRHNRSRSSALAALRRWANMPSGQRSVPRRGGADRDLDGLSLRTAAKPRAVAEVERCGPDETPEASVIPTRRISPNSAAANYRNRGANTPADPAARCARASARESFVANSEYRCSAPGCGRVSAANPIRVPAACRAASPWIKTMGHRGCGWASSSHRTRHERRAPRLSPLPTTRSAQPSARRRIEEPGWRNGEASYDLFFHGRCAYLYGRECGMVLRLLFGLYRIRFQNMKLICGRIIHFLRRTVRPTNDDFLDGRGIAKAEGHG